MNNYKRIVVGADGMCNQYCDVMLTESDNNATFQNFVKKVLTSWENYVINGIKDYYEDDEYISEIEVEEKCEEAKNSCYVIRIDDITEKEANWPVTTDEEIGEDW